MRCATALLIFSLVLSPPVYAGAWLMPKDQGLAIVQSGYFQSDDFFDVDGSKVAQPAFRKWEIQPYVEYGATDWLTVGGSTFLQQVSQSGQNNEGLADTELFARSAVWHSADGREHVSVQPLVKLPSLFTRSGTPRGGSRSTDVELSLLYGSTLEILSERDFADLRVGYRARSRGLNSQWRMDAVLDVQLSEHIQLIPAARVILATQFDDSENFSENAEQDFDLMKLELTAAYHLDEKHWLQLTAFDHVAGAQVGAGRGLMLGIAERF